MNFRHARSPYQLFDVINDPREKIDLYGDEKYTSIVTELKKMYEAERAVAVYPCKRGPGGTANEAGVLQPWLSVHDNCEP